MVEYDPDTHSLKTLSLHYFEEDEFKVNIKYLPSVCRFKWCSKLVFMQDGHCQQQMNHATVRIDPENRCAAMLIYGSRLVILPFRKDLLVAGDSLDAAEG